MMRKLNKENILSSYTQNTNNIRDSLNHEKENIDSNRLDFKNGDNNQFFLGDNSNELKYNNEDENFVNPFDSNYQESYIRNTILDAFAPRNQSHNVEDLPSDDPSANGQSSNSPSNDKELYQSSEFENESTFMGQDFDEWMRNHASLDSEYESEGSSEISNNDIVNSKEKFILESRTSKNAIGQRGLRNLNGFSSEDGYDSKSESCGYSNDEVCDDRNLISEEIIDLSSNSFENDDFDSEICSEKNDILVNNTDSDKESQTRKTLSSVDSANNLNSASLSKQNGQSSNFFSQFVNSGQFDSINILSSNDFIKHQSSRLINPTHNVDLDTSNNYNSFKPEDRSSKSIGLTKNHNLNSESEHSFDNSRGSSQINLIDSYSKENLTQKYNHVNEINNGLHEHESKISLRKNLDNTLPKKSNNLTVLYGQAQNNGALRLPPSNFEKIISKKNQPGSKLLNSENINSDKFTELVSYLENICEKTDMLASDFIELLGKSNTSPSGETLRSENISSSSNQIELNECIYEHTETYPKEATRNVNISTKDLKNNNFNEDSPRISPSLLNNYNNDDVNDKYLLKYEELENKWKILNQEFSFLQKAVENSNKELASTKKQQEGYTKKIESLEISNRNLLVENKGLKSQIIALQSKPSLRLDKSNSQNKSSNVRKSFGLFDSIFSPKILAADPDNGHSQLSQNTHNSKNSNTEFNINTKSLNSITADKNSIASSSLNSFPSTAANESSENMFLNTSNRNYFNVSRNDSHTPLRNSTSKFRNSLGSFSSIGKSLLNFRHKKSDDSLKTIKTLEEQNDSFNSNTLSSYTPVNPSNIKYMTPQNYGTNRTNLASNSLFSNRYSLTPNLVTGSILGRNAFEMKNEKRKHVSTPKIFTSLLSKKKRLN
ncbi:hypothetical protein AYI69_g4264 [Smittium culicis]|uniref:Uncharacterized protein n=1 Tax=Smittium culicis TaxID=133412 RepID=A0A1R1YF01_9FUNG|nr:hypothetical protein AYI69_g4264 [Smittium culicis]